MNASDRSIQYLELVNHADASISVQNPTDGVYNTPKRHLNLAGIEIWSYMPIFLDPLGNYRFSLQLYTRMHGFKYKFSKNFWRGAH